MRSAKNILMLVYSLYSRDGRVKRYVRTLTNKGYHVEVLCCRESKPFTDISISVHGISQKYCGDSKFRQVLSYFIFFIKAFGMISWRSVRHRYEAVHVHNMPNFLVFTAVFPKLFKTKVILDIHDVLSIGMQVKSNFREDSFWIKLLRFEENISIKFADKVICADHFQQKRLKQQTGRQDILVIMNFADEHLFYMESQPIRPPYVGILHGTINDSRGIFFLLKAIESQIVQDLPVIFRVFGDGSSRHRAIDIMHQKGMHHKVSFNNGFISYESMGDELRKSHLGLILNQKNISTDQYEFPTRLFEYLLCGIVVLAPKLQIIQHYISEDDVLYYEPDNVESFIAALSNAVTHHEDISEKIRSRYKMYLEKYSFCQEAERYLQFYSA